MPASHEGPESLEGLAFQLILQKLVSLERAMQGIPPLLQKIVTHLEAQTKQPEVLDVVVEAPSVPRKPRRPLLRWFLKEAR